MIDRMVILAFICAMGAVSAYLIYKLLREKP